MLHATARRALLLCSALLLPLGLPAGSPNPPQSKTRAEAQRPAAAGAEIMPLAEVRPGMKGIAYTIFEGDKIEAMELEVIGILPNALGPGQSVILVRLLGDKPNFTGVVAGMSGSPVYLEGKLAGALSLRIGFFTKEPIAGITPIESVLEANQPSPRPAPASTASAGAGAMTEENLRANWTVPLPAEFSQAASLPAGNYLTPIESPLTASGFLPVALERFRAELGALGMVAAPGGTAEPRDDDARILPGDMVSMVLMRGALSLNASCTVSAIQEDRVFVCGHPVLGYGEIAMPMARGRTVMTVASPLNSFKIVNAGGEIGTFEQDRLTAVMGRLGRKVPLVPVELTLATPVASRTLNFEMIEHPKLTPLLMTIAVFNGLVGNTVYSEGMSFRLTGQMELEDHSPVLLENMFAPTDAGVPDGFFVALSVQNVFARIYTNPYEKARIRRVTLRVESIPERKVASIEGAWSEKSEVSPGETVDVKVMVRPYRGTPYIREVPIRIPEQAPRGMMRILVSDSETLNRMTRLFAAFPQRLQGLEQLITVINKERRNDRLYVTLLQPNPTLLLEEKELPNAPLSQINVLDQRRGGSSSLLLRESAAGEWSIPLSRVITGQQMITITVK